MPAPRPKKPPRPRPASPRELAELAVIRAELGARLDHVAWLRKVKREAGRRLGPKGPWHMTPELYAEAEAALIAAGHRRPHHGNLSDVGSIVGGN